MHSLVQAVDIQIKDQELIVIALVLVGILIMEHRLVNVNLFLFYLKKYAHILVLLVIKMDV